MKFYNTLTRKVEEFIPNEKGKVKFYTCGPTVYHDQHIGNMRNYIGHDILDKTLRYLGYDVLRIMNITDVGHLTSDSDSGEDKMVKSAKESHKSVMDIAKYYTEQFFNDFKLINNRVPDIVKPATGEIDMYIKIITKLLDEEYAYIEGGNVYFDTSKLDDYYKLTNHKEDEMVVGVRDGVEFDSNKHNQADFVLWFTKSKFDDQELKWDSPWGYGYPGWHIECSGISIKYAGEYLDIHGGGVDNIFPHHTNEIAQSESYLGHKWCNYWFHNEHLMDNSGKMSKSKGATLTVTYLKDQGYDPLAFRFMCLNSHYRKQLIFSYEALKQSEETLNKLKNKISNIKDDNNFNEDDFNKYNNEFKNTLENDLNTANAITIIYNILKDNELSGNTKLKLIKSFDEVLSLDLIKEDNIDNELLDKVNKLIEERQNYKKEKNYEKADQIREKIESLGVTIKDTRDGVEIIWN
ncbi:MAG: cysteine--tRNA ligase [Bacilli bacterium]|nr:cysteine--tRNA ligase [Bacilli bacterium]